MIESNSEIVFDFSPTTDDHSSESEVPCSLLLLAHASLDIFLADFYQNSRWDYINTTITKIT